MKVERGDGGGSWRGREGGREGGMGGREEEEDRELKVGEDSDGEEEEGRAGGS